MRHPVIKFLLHYVEMVVAMGVGMVALYPLWHAGLDLLAVDAQPWTDAVETDSLVMGTSMAVPMAGWMRFRGHGWTPTLEMSAAMYAGFVVLWPFAWVGALAPGDVLDLGHVLMLLAMAGAMLLRREEFTGSCATRAQSQPASRAAR